MDLANPVKDEEKLDHILQLLDRSLNRLENAVDTHLDDRRRLKSLDSEISDMMLDRSRLAQSLDKAEARAMRLEDANKEVSRRLVTAMDSIRSVLEKQDRK